MLEYLKEHTISGFSLDVSTNRASYTGMDKEVHIPNGVKKLSNYLIHMNHTVESLFIPKSVEVIEDNAIFQCSKLKAVYIEKGSNLSVIKDYSFFGCPNLSFFEFNNACNLTELGLGTFSNCGFVNLDLSHFKIEKLHRYTFFRNNLQTIKLPETLQFIGPYCFSDNCLQSIVIPKSVNQICQGAFSFNISNSLTILNDLTNISDKAFDKAFEDISAAIEMPFCFSGEIHQKAFEEFFMNKIKEQYPFVIWTKV